MCKLREFTLTDMQEGSLEPLVAIFNDCLTDCEEVRIFLKHNSGGDVPPTFELIEGIRYSDIKVRISTHGFIFSAAALFYFYLYFEKQNGNFKNVTFDKPNEPVVCLFHTPRNIEGTRYIRFPENIPTGPEKPIPLGIEEQAKVVNRIYFNIIDELELAKPKDAPQGECMCGLIDVAQHTKECWDNNCDFIFLWQGSFKGA